MIVSEERWCGTKWGKDGKK